MHNASGSRRVMCEAKSPEELQEFLAGYLKEEHQAMTKIEHPAYQLRLVIELHETGFWMVYTETVLKENFGGEIFQEQSFEHHQAVHEVSQARVQPAGL